MKSMPKYVCHVSLYLFQELLETDFMNSLLPELSYVNDDVDEDLMKFGEFNSNEDLDRSNECELLYGCELCTKSSDNLENRDRFRIQIHHSSRGTVFIQFSKNFARN